MKPPEAKHPLDFFLATSLENKRTPLLGWLVSNEIGTGPCTRSLPPDTHGVGSIQATQTLYLNCLRDERICLIMLVTLCLTPHPIKT